MKAELMATVEKLSIATKQVLWSVSSSAGLGSICANDLDFAYDMLV